MQWLSRQLLHLQWKCRKMSPFGCILAAEDFRHGHCGKVRLKMSQNVPVLSVLAELGLPPPPDASASCQEMSSIGAAFLVGSETLSQMHAHACAVDDGHKAHRNSNSFRRELRCYGPRSLRPFCGDLRFTLRVPKFANTACQNLAEASVLQPML